MSLIRRWTLAMDTATDQASIAFLNGSEVAERSWPGGRQQTTMLLPQVQNLARGMNIDLSALELIVVSIGPGSFTGLRVGLSVAKGFVLATGCALIGVPTGARQSTPLCSRTTLRMGWRRGPKVDVSTPFTGVTMPLVTVSE